LLRVNRPKSEKSFYWVDFIQVELKEF